ncbi:Dabb family protein [bacterium AH-315-I20]|nr:Dabb family protein [bacterium AH-315-I20]PCI02012.1 MAG: stress responsive protein [Zetaproteobacteria bacterium]
MVKHIVMWTLEDNNDATLVKTTLEGLKNKVPSIIDIEVGIDFSATDASADVILYSTFTNREGLDAYVNHPEHQAVIPMMQRVTTSRKVVDYEI